MSLTISPHLYDPFRVCGRKHTHAPSRPPFVPQSEVALRLDIVMPHQHMWGAAPEAGNEVGEVVFYRANLTLGPCRVCVRTDIAVSGESEAAGSSNVPCRA